VKFDLRPYEATASAALVPPPSRNVFFKPLFLQSFTSLSQPSVERKHIENDALPAGAETGIIVHRIFERLFDHPSPLSDLVAQEIAGSRLEGYETAVHHMIDQVLDLPLKGFSLRDIDRSKVMPEMEFLFPDSGASIKGFIDLCFEHQGKFYLVDWKTNLLENYTPETLETAMQEHDYFLQGRIYATALTRYLKLYGNLSFGGVFFLFVRGPAAYHFIPEPYEP
jgi:exodeoxyribonuclease V beta subunit